MGQVPRGVQAQPIERIRGLVEQVELPHIRRMEDEVARPAARRQRQALQLDRHLPVFIDAPHAQQVLAQVGGQHQRPARMPAHHVRMRLGAGSGSDRPIGRTQRTVALHHGAPHAAIAVMRDPCLARAAGVVVEGQVHRQRAARRDTRHQRERPVVGIDREARELVTVLEQRVQPPSVLGQMEPGRAAFQRRRKPRPHATAVLPHQRVNAAAVRSISAGEGERHARHASRGGREGGRQAHGAATLRARPHRGHNRRS